MALETVANRCVECDAPLVANQRRGEPRRFCSERCRYKSWVREHPRQPTQPTLFGLTEKASHPDSYPREMERKELGMKAAAGNNVAMLNSFQTIADWLWFQHRLPVSIEDVRTEADKRGLVYTSGNWLGSVFREGGWKREGFVKAGHSKSHARMVSTWVKR